MGVPAVDVSVTPLIKRLPNLLDLPLISKFVKMAIAAGVGLFALVGFGARIADYLFCIDGIYCRSKEYDSQSARDAEWCRSWR
jgi:hypothetical protein